MTDIPCAAARELLLVAEPEELETRSHSPLAAHLRSCDACATIARDILNTQASLADALAALTAPQPRAPAMQHARHVPMLRRVMFAAAPLAAAAVLLLMRLQSETGTSGRFEPLFVPPPEVPSTTVVNAAASGDVAVLRTADPNITIVWNLERPR